MSNVIWVSAAEYAYRASHQKAQCRQANGEFAAGILGAKLRSNDMKFIFWTILKILCIHEECLFSYVVIEKLLCPEDYK